jgi:heme-degrading monooxygenase HmoA
MISEIADIDITAGSEEAFEAAVTKALPLFAAARGCLGLDLQRGIERDNRYTLIVRWETLEDHTVHFRNSPAFTQWRGLVGAYFAGTPKLQHVRRVVTSGEA